MQTEIEVKFLNTSHAELREKLENVGAELIAPMRLMKRAIIETPTLAEKDAFIRIRDEGDRVTLTYKQFEGLSIDGAKELEVTVSDFETTVAIMKSVDLLCRSVQESKRETWRLEDTEIVLDEWPWLEPYIEIEGESEERVRKVAAILGFEWKDAVFGDVMAAYRKQYPHLSENDTVANIPVVRFEDPLPELLRH